MSAALPPPMPTNPLRRIALDLQRERAASVPFPPGEMRPSVRRTRRIVVEPLPEILRLYREYGPVFSMRVLHAPVTMMIGPEANHYMLVSNASNFVWREGSFGDLIPLIGDGLLTIDGPAHRTARRLLLPAFHHEQVAATVDTMVEEIDAALRALGDGETRLDVYDWVRHLALRVAMRALLGIDPDSRADGHDPAREWEAALSYYGRDLVVQAFRGPGTPFARMRLGHKRLTALVAREIEARRRGDGAAADRGGVLSLLLEARDEDGRPLSDAALRDHVLTLLFAGHDTTTATITFLLYELVRNPHQIAPLREELDDVLAGGRAPTADDLIRRLPRLDMAVDETLRMYPPAWIGPRRSVDPFEFAGRSVPGGVHVNYCSWASHRIPEVFPDPDRFLPERFAPEAKAKLPKGAYVPFGGGSRTCIGMRFGLLEVKAIAALLIQRHDFGLRRGYKLRIRQTPTLGPRDGMPMALRRLPASENRGVQGRRERGLR
jgi:cytochrome P450